MHTTGQTDFKRLLAVEVALDRIITENEESKEEEIKEGFCSEGGDLSGCKQRYVLGAHLPHVVNPSPVTRRNLA